MPSEKLSVVDDGGEYSSRCGYCNGRNSSRCHGMTAVTLTPADYQRLIDRGWRRSGTWLYKPCMQVACCKTYTIRLQTESFKPSKDQRRVLRRFERYLEGHDVRSGPHGEGADMEVDEGRGGSGSRRHSHHGAGSRHMGTDPAGKGGDAVSSLSAAIAGALRRAVARGAAPGVPGLEPPAPAVTAVTAAVRAKQNLPEDIVMSSPVASQYLGWLKKKASPPPAAPIPSPDALLAAIVSDLDAPEGRASLPEGVAGVSGAKGFLNIHGTHALREAMDAAVARPAARAPTSTTRDHTGPSAARTASPPLQPHSFEFITRPSAFDREEFDLYRRYQAAVHDDDPDDITERQYARFLVDGPMPPPEALRGSGSPPDGLGAFHQQYRLDGRLLAVGVVDLLPGGLSSKYFFWDPDYAFLALGKLGALKEIEYVERTRASAPGFQYYYMGFYIRTCPKMRYKGEYSPSELLCPGTYTWWRLDQVEALLDRTPYCEFGRELGGVGAGEAAATAEDAAQDQETSPPDLRHQPAQASDAGSEDAGSGATGKEEGSSGVSEEDEDEEEDDDGEGPESPVTGEKRTAALTTKVLLGGRQLVSLGALVRSGAAPAAQLEHIVARVARWREACGPVADRLVYALR